jgi:2-hydroxychromene-2-carboxylate isomerase
LKQVEFLFDYGSPFSYLADTQIPALAARSGAKIIYTPVLLGGVLKATGNASPITVPAKGKYMSVELRRWANRYGIPELNNKFFPINTMKLMRGAVASQQLGVFDRYHAAIFPAFWGQGLNLGDDGVLAGVLEAAGLPGAEIARASETGEVKDRLRKNTDDAVARGMFGAPALFVGNEMYWGNDRLDWVEQALAKLSA